ncbi:DUF1275 domain-containing protein [Sphingomonas suaedae]|uniref:DUF1275 domain-containing protein n=1 Tax=Sphingomonas suaedae TaxID=2599297 RepID=A0A518RFQ2_9SPHN|nr:DUF1275 family protein [Sphingomonas suaedae]QDX26273.1 DUF1275 domain-containing protein [Sphingomonas suaedae]
MQSYAPRFIALAVALAALAGFVDAIAFTRLGGYFVSFMSGNSTRLGVGIGLADGTAVLAAALILAFVAGVMGAAIIARRFAERRKVAVLGAVTATLAAAAGLWMIRPGPLPLLLVAAAMGMENGVFARDGEVAIGVSYMTGSLVRMAQRLAGALMGDPDRWAFVPHLMLWLGFAVGVVMGAKVGLAAADLALWIAALAAGGLTLVAAGLTRGATR